MGQCTAKSKRTGERCKRMCAPGKIVCKWHGGASPGGKHGNKNAIKHGLYEKIINDTLMDGEAEYAESIDVEHPVEILKEQIRILKIKEARIAKRMKAVLMEEQAVNKVGPDGKKKSEFTKLTLNVVQNIDPDGSVKKTIASNSETLAMHYMRLDDAHTKVLAQLRRATLDLVKMQDDLGITHEPLPLYTCPPKEENEGIA